jgi:hypothetical protein
MKIDMKLIVGFLGTILIGLSTWILVSIVDLKEDSSMFKGELLGINRDIGRIYNYVNGKIK